jgi:TolA-binding protein
MRERLKEIVSSLRKGTGSSLRLTAFFALGAGLALGCGWYGTEHSVRFNRWHSELMFTRLPPLPFDARKKKTTRDAADDAHAGEEAGERTKETDAVWSDAAAAVGAGDFAKARKLLHDYVERTGGRVCDEYDAPFDCAARRSSARDRLDALASLDRGASARAVAAYLEARDTYEGWLVALDGVKESREDDRTNAWSKPTSAAGAQAQPEAEQAVAEEKKKSDDERAAASLEAVGAAFGRVPREPGLEDNVEYLRAAVLYRSDEGVAAAEAFGRLAALYPRSEKREAALYMRGFVLMHLSRAYTGEAATLGNPCSYGCDDLWAASVAAFERVLREYPRGDYSGDARGWLAYMHIRAGEMAEGLAEYYRMLADERDADAREEALLSLHIVRDKATEQEMARVESILEDEPRAALTYAYHDIYNYAPSDDGYVEVPEERNPYKDCKERAEDPCRDSFYTWEEKERQRILDTSRNKALARVAAFATRLMLRTPAASGGGAFALRVAQADLELGENRSARELASRALASGLRGNERASALWVRGVAEYGLKEVVAARRTFESLIAEFPEGDLIEGARRYVAMAAEDAGDLDAALEQYIALDYTDDTAYFVDVLMTPEQLASFVESHKDSPARDVLLYSLGVRLMRDHRFAEARSVYARVRTSNQMLKCGEAPSCGCDEKYPPPRCSEAKNPRWEKPEGVWPAWVTRDLKTMDELEHLEARAASAVGDEAKAEALYRLASYLYQSSPLVFYNPAAWKGGRFFAIYYDQQFREPGEEQLMRRYMESHEPVVRALKIYLQIAEDYPHTRAARDALYTAAVAHERLSRLQLYWPDEYGAGLYAGDRLVTYEDVRRTYPDYRLPAGTYGWEPLTRTVYGRAAWPAPPKAKQPTGVERARSKIARAERRVSQAWGLFGEVYGGRVRNWTVRALRWALAALVAAFVLLVFRRTRRTRRFLYRQFARRMRRGRASRAVRAPYAPASSYAAHVPFEWGGRLRAAASDTMRGLLRLALHERGRAALALNLFTHGLLTLLVWSLVWAAR